MPNRQELIAAVLGIAGAICYYSYRRKRERVVLPEVLQGHTGDTILSDLPDNPANLIYLTRAPWMIVPIKAFRADDKDFPKPHRYRDPQGPIADIYNPTLRGN